MNDRDPDAAEAIRQIAAVLATAYLRIRFPEPAPTAVDSAETASVHVTAG